MDIDNQRVIEWEILDPDYCKKFKKKRLEYTVGIRIGSKHIFMLGHKRKSDDYIELPPSFVFFDEGKNPETRGKGISMSQRDFDRFLGLLFGERDKGLIEDHIYGVLPKPEEKEEKTEKEEKK
ncbi:MAG: hypothetical protein ACXADC_16830 [Candidatus Thorarchaeota archaeon]